MWEPTTFEDKLLMRYLEDNPGELFLEVSVSFLSDPKRARRIDGILVPGESKVVYPPGRYSLDQFKDAVQGSTIHLLEAKASLGRYVIGQALVGESLIKKVFQPKGILMVIVCGYGNPDMQWYCDEHGIKVATYPSTGDGELNQKPISVDRIDVRSQPDSARKRAFLAGWADAVKGKLYGSIHNRKTHANMGNLFGWIYGDMPAEFRSSTWDYYISHAGVYWDANEG